MVRGATLRFLAQPAIESGNHDSRNGAKEERRTPAPKRAQLSARYVAQRRADRNRDVKDRKDAVALALRVEVGQHGWGEDAECGLTDADQCVAKVEGPVVVNPGGGQSGQAPQNRTANDERLARQAVAQPAGDRRSEHVAQEQGCSERAHLLVSRVELALDK